MEWRAYYKFSYTNDTTRVRCLGVALIGVGLPPKPPLGIRMTRPALEARARDGSEVAARNPSRGRPRATGGTDSGVGRGHASVGRPGARIDGAARGTHSGGGQGHSSRGLPGARIAGAARGNHREGGRGHASRGLPGARIDGAAGGTHRGAAGASYSSYMINTDTKRYIVIILLKHQFNCKIIGTIMNFFTMNCARMHNGPQFHPNPCCWPWLRWLHFKYCI